MSNSLGKLFSVTSFGESHGELVGVVIDGCPAGLALSEADLQPDLDRRKPGMSSVSSPRQEEDKGVILSGVFSGRTTGAPLCLAVWNEDKDSSAYEKTRFVPRPGHADYTAYVKYGGYADYRGGGRFSGRITSGLVMAGAVAKKLLATLRIEVLAHTTEIGGIKAIARDYDEIRKNAPGSAVHCSNLQTAEVMVQTIEKARQSGDSLGGIIEVIALGVPAGLGEPVFDTLEGELSKAFFAIPAVKGVEFGAGFSVSHLKGSENNDPFTVRKGRVLTTSNRAGGALGGISTGMPVVARIAVKPTPSISQPQRSVDLQTMSVTELAISGRHDPCIVPRAVVVTEAAMAVVLCDLAMRAGKLPGVLA
ncbi:MAG: chorismate synthase [Dehalococcoidia bacterium]|nr:MAG: chorismate synthase [Dehalococcoidia bacterium]